MPLYDYRCPACGEEAELYRTLSDHATAPQHCGQSMVQIHKAAPMGSVQVEARYQCPVTGVAVTSRRQRLEIMKRENLREALPAAEVIRNKRKWRERINTLANSGPQITAEQANKLAAQAGL